MLLGPLFQEPWKDRTQTLVVSRVISGGYNRRCTSTDTVVLFLWWWDKLHQISHRCRIGLHQQPPPATTTTTIGLVGRGGGGDQDGILQGQLEGQDSIRLSSTRSGRRGGWVVLVGTSILDRESHALPHELKSLCGCILSCPMQRCAIHSVVGFVGGIDVANVGGRLVGRARMIQGKKNGLVYQNGIFLQGWWTMRMTQGGTYYPKGLIVQNVVLGGDGVVIWRRVRRGGV